MGYRGRLLEEGPKMPGNEAAENRKEMTDPPKIRVPW